VAWFGLGTDATRYARTATFHVSDSGDRIRGQWSGQSPEFTTFGPAIPEPETYALMLAGLGIMVLRRRVRQRQGEPQDFALECPIHACSKVDGRLNEETRNGRES
jgi:hypothetical protein